MVLKTEDHAIGLVTPTQAILAETGECCHVFAACASSNSSQGLVGVAGIHFAFPCLSCSTVMQAMP